MTVSEYATTLELARFMHSVESIPNVEGSAPTYETVGTGDGSNATFYLDHNKVIAGSYTLYYGASQSSLTALTETTHYSLDKDTGVITLTTTGKTIISTNNIYAAYSFNSLKISDTQAQDALNQAVAGVEERTRTVFTDGTAATPAYTQVTNEKHKGKGRSDRDYYTRFCPLPDVSCTLDGDHVAGVTTITVDSTSGFPSTGYFLIDSEKVTYSAKTGTTFTVTATSDAHDDGATIIPHIIEVSTTCAGSEPSWTVLANESGFDLKFISGRFHVYRDDMELDVYMTSSPPRDTPNRVRMTYLYGYSTVPNDVKRLVLMIAAKDLMHSAIRKTVADGRGTQDITLINVDEVWIEKTINRYACENLGNT